MWAKQITFTCGFTGWVGRHFQNHDNKLSIHFIARSESMNCLPSFCTLSKQLALGGGTRLRHRFDLQKWILFLECLSTFFFTAFHCSYLCWFSRWLFFFLYSKRLADLPPWSLSHDQPAVCKAVSVSRFSFSPFDECWHLIVWLIQLHNMCVCAFYVCRLNWQVEELLLTGTQKSFRLWWVISVLRTRLC